MAGEACGLPRPGTYAGFAEEERREVRVGGKAQPLSASGRGQAIVLQPFGLQNEPLAEVILGTATGAAWTLRAGVRREYPSLRP